MDVIFIVSVTIDNEIKPDKINETDKNNINDTEDTDEPHNGNPINLSSNGEYLVTYSKVDSSIICWNVENVNENQLKSEFSVKLSTDGNVTSDLICTRNEKINLKVGEVGEDGIGIIEIKLLFREWWYNFILF
ncbi:hypothetical protein C1646_750207 [Rhizophagus diaphanus]|nr:hypothetical protein C1646_750207 [Rhizophagus diaphanus] [Rhizophagus sp. MUCL 43196]